MKKAKKAEVAVAKDHPADSQAKPAKDDWQSPKEFDAYVAMVAQTGNWYVLRGNKAVLGPFNTEVVADAKLKRLKAAYKKGKLVW